MLVEVLSVTKPCRHAQLYTSKRVGKAMLFYKAQPPMLCTTQKIMPISNHQNLLDFETDVAKVRKRMLAEGVRQRMLDQNEDQN